MAPTPHKSYVQRYPKPARLINWLNAEPGRAAYFAKVDDFINPPMISKIKAGIVPITLEMAIRLERAQKASDDPLKAEELMTFAEHRTLYRYVTGQEPAPEQLVITRKARIMADDPMRPAA